jgi:putative ABC transport system permease protein
MISLWQDLSYALRTLGKSKGFTAVAVVILSLGIGANTGIFSLVNAVLLQPLTYPEPDRIVRLLRSFPQGIGTSTSIPKFTVWCEQTQVFQDIAAYDFEGPGVNLTGGDRPEQLKGIHVSAGYFGVFGATVAAGRTFTADEDRPGGPHVVVISNGLWRSRFGSDSGLVGRTISLQGEPYVVIGILGPNFTTNPPTDLWLPLQADPNSTDQANYLLVAARLKPGVTLEAAKAAMKIAAEEFRRKSPSFMSSGENFTAEPFKDALIPKDVRAVLLELFGAVGFVLLIACANVANLQLVRSTLRSREIAIRAAVGARPSRIIRQLLTESVLLSLGGGGLGLVIGYVGVRGLLALNPGDIPGIGDQGSAVTLDWRVLIFTLLVCFLTGILFGLIPAFKSSRTDLIATLKEGGGRSGTGLDQNKARSFFVITEIALALILLTGAALLVRTLMALKTVDPGFDSHNVLTMEMSLEGTRFEKTGEVAQLVRDAQQRITSLPGVGEAATTYSIPLELGPDLPFTIEGRQPTDGRYEGDVQWRSVSPSYFEVFRIALLRGRLFMPSDVIGSTPVVVINASMARQFWPKGDPIGERITIGKGVGPEFEEPARQIIGLVANVRDMGLNRDLGPIMYVPLAQINDGVNALFNRIIPLKWVIRTKVEPFSLSAPIQREIRAASGGLPVAHVRSMDQVVVESTARTGFNMMLLTIFAGIALLLAAIGIYGLTAYSVQQRTREIGVRMVLGAGPQQVRNMVVLEGVRLVFIGVVVGVASGLALTRLMASLLYGVKTWDPIVFTSVTILLSAVALLAIYVPARRATRIDPINALRYE